MDETAWVASEAVKLAWRDRHPAIAKLWRDVEAAAVNAIKHPGRTFRAGPHLRVGVRDHAGHRYLLIKLPSSRYLVYYDPRLTDDGAITYMGMGNEDGGTAKIWCRLHTYGGKLIENATQAFARDVLAANMQAIEDAGYQIVLTVHDEVIAEAPTGAGIDTLIQHLAAVPPWADGLPLAADGFEATRYRKD
jgi:DNA polymerase